MFCNFSLVTRARALQLQLLLCRIMTHHIVSLSSSVYDFRTRTTFFLLTHSKNKVLFLRERDAN